jgi:hypothetical protein
MKRAIAVVLLASFVLATVGVVLCEAYVLKVHKVNVWSKPAATQKTAVKKTQEKVDFFKPAPAKGAAKAAKVEKTR